MDKNKKYGALAIGLILLIFGGVILLRMELSRLEVRVQSTEAEAMQLRSDIEGLVEENKSSFTESNSAIVAIQETSINFGISFSELATAFENLESSLSDQVANQMVSDIIESATAQAIRNALDSDSIFLTALGTVLAEDFNTQLKGEPGAPANEENIISLLIRSSEFLEAISVEILQPTGD